MQFCDDDQLLASAARFLIDGNEEDAANVLLSCSLNIWESGDHCFAGDEVHSALHVKMSGPRAAYEILNDEKNPITTAIRNALSAVIPEDTYIRHFTVHVGLVELDPNWRSELLEIARGKGIHNQAVSSSTLRTWKNLKFRSQSEIKIAEALERSGVLFLPNCRARLGLEAERQNKEADFLICDSGKWGILEVDGEPFHPPSRTTQDHERDRLFKMHGILLVEHFDASECFKKPDDVVRKFLDLLEKS